ncbi:MAG TPA: hypothetical protein VN176_08670 [Verrucomicrobiae bacterium]|jgi:hypothetical protein|nr:hypothetical protein [Verrucomicrobiae bacterium]
MQINWLSEAFNWFSMPALAVLAVVFVRRGLQREFPFFFSFVIATEVIGIIRLIAYAICGSRTYFYVYWGSDAVATLLACLAIYEMFVRRLFVGFYKIRFYRYLFPVAASIVMMGAFLITVASHAKPDFSIESRLFEFMRAAMLIFFTALMLLMGREWSRYELGISLGFGVYIIPSFVRFAEWSQSHHSSLIREIGLIGWDVACCIWLVCFWKPPSQAHKLSSDHVDVATVQEAREWQDALKTWFTRGKRLP